MQWKMSKNSGSWAEKINISNFMNSEPKNMPIEASDREMDSVMLGIESRTISEEMPKKLEKMLIQRSTVKRKKDLCERL